MKAKAKGLEPIVAAVLLIVVAVVGAVLLYLWFAGYITRTTSQAGQMMQTEKIEIEGASLSASTQNATLYIRNVGDVSVNISAIYVINPTTQGVVCYYSFPTTNQPTINPGTVMKVSTTTWTVGCGLTSGKQYVLQVATSRGTQASTIIVAS
ncbi:MAG: flagellar biosynthesis protein FlaG [Thermoproteus sp.]